MNQLICWANRAVAFAALLSTLVSGLAHAAVPPEVAKGQAWLQAQVLTDGTLTNEALSIATPLQNRAESLQTFKFLAAVPPALADQLAADTADNTEYLARRAMTLSMTGRDASAITAQLTARQNPDGGFGGSGGYNSNPLDTTFAMLALAQNTLASTPAGQAARTYLLASIQTDGGVGPGSDSARINANALALLALQMYPQDLATANALKQISGWLLLKQGADGSWLKNSNLTAYALAAVAPLTSDPVVSSTATTYLKGLQGADGSWGGGDPFLTAVVLRALTLGAPAPAPATSAITGLVVDQATTAALAGATVTLSGAASATLTTGMDGKINFPSLPAGSYTLQISSAGYNSYSGAYPLNTAQSLNIGVISLVQVATTGIVSGKVTAAATGLPLAGATVTAGALTATTDANGLYRIAGVTPGAVTLSASAAGYAATSAAGNVAGGQTLNFSPALYAAGAAVPTTGVFTGKVVAAGTNLPLAGVSIQLNGAAAGVTAADGSFKLTLAPASYSAAFILTGYSTATSTFLLTAGATVNAGTITLTPQQTATAISGVIKDAATGNPISGAQVQMLNGQVATTGTNGAYTLSGLAGTTFDLRASATGYVTQSVRLTVSQPMNVTQDFALQVQTGLGLSLSALQVTPGSVGSMADVGISAILANAATGTPATVVLTLQVTDAQGKIIGTAAAYDKTGANMLSQIPLNPGQQLPVLFKWNSGQFPAGAYTLTAKVIAVGSITQTTPLGQVLTTGQGALSIIPGPHFSGTVTANPPVLQAGANTPVHLSAVLSNDGNVSIPAQAYQLTITNQATGAVVATQQANGAAFSPNGLQTLAFADWTPVAGGGNFRIDVQAVASLSMGDVIGKVYVGDAATGVFTVNKLAVPAGTQAVKGNIHVTGQDSTQGVLGDALAPLIKTAIQKAVAYNDATASNWILSNGCSGCHVGAQALVGGEMNLKIAPAFDPAQRNIIFNKLASAQNADGSITPSPAHINTFVQAQTYLSLWGLNSWHAKQDIAGTLVKAANYTINKQDPSGGWWTDYPYGWWYSAMINTGLNTKNLVDVATLIQQTPASLLPTIDTVAPLLPNAQVFGEGAVMDAAGNLYVTNASVGTLSLVKPDGTIVTLLAGLSVPRPPAFGADGALYIPSDGGVIKYTLAGQATTLTTVPVSSVALGPDGNIYASACWTQKILQITQAGVVSVYLSGGPLWYPVGITFDQSGALLAAQWNGDILKFNPDKTYRTVAYANGNGLSLVQTTSGDWLAGTTRGLFRYNSAWQLQSTISSNQVSYVYRTPDGRVLLNGSTTANPYTIFYLTKGPLVSTPMLDTSIANAAKWMLNDSNANAGDNIELAFRLIGLGEAKKYFAGTPMAATLQTKMDQVGALLRSHQLPDGGWTHGCYWVNNWWGPSLACSSGSDSMVTAQVGMALDYLNPAPTDPVVQNAVKLLLSRQQPDGSWVSENGVLTTHLAATTWVAIWLPIALDRIGGIDTDLSVSMPANVTLANPAPAPTSSAANAAGGVDYLWHLPGVRSAGVDVNFDLSLKNMALGENRPVATDAHLTFNNTFTNQPTTAPIAIPRVTASAFLGLGVTTDQTNYGANSPVNITSAVNNTSVTGPLDGSVKLEIYSADNILNAVVGTQPFTGLAAGAQTSLNATWGTGTIAAGSYYVLATLYDAQNRQVGTAKSAFNIVSGVGVGTPAGATGVGATIAVDKPAYLPFDRVQMTSRITNLTLNQVQSGLQAVTTIYRPDGAVQWTQTAPLQQLLAGAFIDLGSSAQLSAAPAGQYRVALSVQTTGAAEVAKGGTSFTVLSTAVTGSGLKGTITAQPKIVPQTDPVILNWTISDLGNADFAALPVTVTIIDPVTQQVMTQQPSTIAVVQGQTYQTAFNWATDPANVGSTYIAILSVTVGGKTIVLAQDNFLVTEPPVRLDVKQSTVRENRLLIWLACNPADDQKATDNPDATHTSDPASGQKNGNDQKAGDKDKAQPPVPACIKARTAYLQTLLASLNIPYLITNNRDDFKKAFREGKYNVYWLSGDINHDGAAGQDSTNKNSSNKDGANKDGSNKDGAHRENDGEGLFKEIREAINRGDGLILDGGAQHIEPLREAAGLNYSGQLPKANVPLTTTGLLFAAAPMPTQGAAQKMPATTGISEANFNMPVNADDQHNNDHQNNDGQNNDQQKNDGQHNDHPEDDAHKPAPVWPAIISNDYGRGHALAFGFDLVDTLQNSATPPAWAPLLQTGLTHILPPLPDTYSGGAYVELDTTIQNLARAVDLAVATQLPPGVTLLQSAPNATLDANGQPAWLFNLPAAAAQPLLLTMRLPLQTGNYTAHTTIDSIRNGKTRRYGAYDYNWTIAASDPLATKLANDLNALLLKSEEEIEARDAAVAKLQRAVTYIAQAKYGKALEALLAAVDKLRKINSVDTSGCRLAFDSLLQETAWNWLRTGGDKETSEAQHPEKDAHRQQKNADNK